MSFDLHQNSHTSDATVRSLDILFKSFHHFLVFCRYWTTEGVQLKICMQDAFLMDTELVHCTEIDPRRSPGPSVSVMLPPGELFEVKF